MARPRIDDVARLAGVSKTAVSFAFNQPDHLNAVTRDRILAAAEELGYRPSPLARRLAARRTRQIGLVIPQSSHDIFANPFLAELLRGIGDVCDQEGIAVVLVPPVGGSMASAVEEALVDGLILLGLQAGPTELGKLGRSGLPIVALDVAEWDGASTITIDDAGGARAAARHLRDLGHHDVAAVLMAEHPETPLNESGGISGRRMAGVRAGLGLESDGSGDVRLRVLSAPVSAEGGTAAFEALATDGMPTAVLTMSDVTAIGLMQAATDAGMRLPEELSVIGFDDIPAASWVTPRLTTVHQPIREKGRLAASWLMDSIGSGDRMTPAHELLPTRLVVRGSTAPAGRTAVLPGAESA